MAAPTATSTLAPEWRPLGLALGRIALRFAPVLMLLLIVAHSVYLYQGTKTMRRFSDERAHMRQIHHLCEGSWQLEPSLPMLPGYHIVSAALAKATGECTDARLRAINVVFGWLVLLTALCILIALRSRWVLLRTLQFHWLPILFPYHFMAFTDVMSLLPALWTGYFVLKRRWTAAGVLGTLAIGWRQTNVILLLFIGLVALIEQDKSLGFWRWSMAYLKKVWFAALGLMGFAAFVVSNQGVALGDRERHELGLHVALMFFVIALSFMAALPVNMQNLWRRRAMLRSPLFLLSLTAAGTIYANYFLPDHPYNSRPSCLRNRLLLWVMAAPDHKALFFIPIALGFAALWVTPWVRRSFVVILPVALVVLLPEGLVEHRYGILPIAFWMLLRRDGSVIAETLTVVVNFCIGTLFAVFVSQRIGL